MQKSSTPSDRYLRAKRELGVPALRAERSPCEEADDASDGEEQRLLLRGVVEHDVRRQSHWQHEQDDADVDEHVELVDERLLIPGTGSILAVDAHWQL